MTNQHFYQPQVIYTRLKDIFNENQNNETEDFSPQNYIKPKTIKKVLESNEKQNKNKKGKNNLPEEKKKYINKELVESWIEAIKTSSNLIDNSKECINKVKAEFNLKNQQIENIKNNSSKYDREDLEINDANFLKVVAEKVEYYKQNYFDKDNPEEIIEDNLDKQIRKLINPPKKLDAEKNKKKRRFEILKKNLIFLRDNHISISDLVKNNPINIKPFQIKESIEFLDAIKYDKFEEIENLAHANKSLLFCYDYLHQTAFHWAAKRNKIKALRILLNYGKCINLLDNNKMTPLHLAAQNNFYDIVQILCDNGANPLMENIDGKKASELCNDFRIKSYLNSAEDLFPPGLRKSNSKLK